ncbi:phosphotransferase [Photobacterium sp. DNB23_23_1]
MVLDILKKHQVISQDHATATPLTGGVSCEIYLVEDHDKKIVAKRALEKLKVEQDWFADTSRNLFEQRYLKYVGKQFPQYVPKILHSFEEERLFTMEFFPESFKDWKKALMQGDTSVVVAKKIGVILASIHKVSWHEEIAQNLFKSDSNFYELRLEPYFESMIDKHPQLADEIKSLCGDVANTKHCLVHGDFSPKNILVSDEEIKIVDCEVAWYGDPAFDVAFLLHHLLLKASHFRNRKYLDLAKAFHSRYRKTIGDERYDVVCEAKVVQLTLMMMLARIDGKSPVEYLSPDEKNVIREQIIQWLNMKFDNLDQVLEGVVSNENTVS